tara:strand:- start:28 stop:204 length:177 start_codon:yes stop_codon:yes gene_type:complete
MKISNAQYTKNPDTKENEMVRANIDGENMWIPLDPNNRHYAEILRQVKEGTLTIKDAE